jgi:thioredoxin 2
MRAPTIALMHGKERRAEVEPMTEARHIVCPHCAATNRVPVDKPALAACCGVCHRALFDGHPAAVDGVRLEKHSRGDLPVLLDI